MSEWSIEDVDVDAYLRRVGVERAPVAPSIDALAMLHRAHLSAIPFENLEPLCGSPPSLVLGEIADKLVRRRRGGYCFEQNLLFAAALERLGFQVDRLAARVRIGRQLAAPGPRTHMTLRVRVPHHDDAWLADVGFGAMGPWSPVPMRGEPSMQGPLTFAVREEGEGTYVLHGRGADADFELYAFTLAAQHHSDYVVANHFTGAYPRSPFVTAPFLGRIQRDERIALRGTTLTVRSAHRIEERTIAAAETVALVRERFGITLSEDESRRLRERLAGRSASPAEAVRTAVVDAMIAAYEEAGMHGLCGEGRFELAIDRARNVELS